MYWIILIVITVIIFGAVGIANASTRSKTSPKDPSPFKKFDDNNPYEIYKIAHALSCIAAIAGESHVYILLKNDNSTNGRYNYLGINASIDKCIASREEFIPSDIRAYLKSIPFTMSETSDNYQLAYTFKNTSSALANGVMDEMKKGANKSPFVQHELQRFNISIDGGLIMLHAD